MHHWTNTAQAPSRLDERKDNALTYVMDKMDIPECGRSVIKDGIHKHTEFALHVDKYKATAGPWEFHPVMQMSFNKNGIDYTTTTVTADGIQAKGKYIPVMCGDKEVHVAYFPRCGNIAVFQKKEKEVVIKKEYQTVYKYNYIPDIRYEECHTVPIPSTILLLVLGLVTIWRFRR